MLKKKALGSISSPLDISTNVLATSIESHIIVYLPVCICNIQVSVWALIYKDGGISKPSV